MPKTGVYGYIREAVRVKVKKCEKTVPPEYRKFSIDPHITSFEVLQSIIAKAFDIKGEFTISYKTVDDYSQEALLPLLSDWDLDAAFLSASDPCLILQVETKTIGDETGEWQAKEVTASLSHKDVFGTIEIPKNQVTETKIQNRLPGLIMNRMERTLNIFQKAFNLGEDQISSNNSSQSSRPPLTDSEFRKYLDPIGQICQMKELRTTIYYGGVEPSLRKVVWKHILNVYPEGMSGRERMDYMKKKSYEYEILRNIWREMIQKGQVVDELTYVTSMVRKDVLRTDRHHKFYAGSDDNQNIASLFNILTTYALNHPSVSYCQGMSDLASPLLVTMNDEAHAYICFCALMTRLKPNFMLDGITMTLKFQHLTEGLTYYDPEFLAYLKHHQAEDLLFCYRWLLLEMKREFAFDDALHMLEVLWSSLPPSPPKDELLLFEVKYSPHLSCLTPTSISPLLKTPRENPYTKVCALRRQSSSMSLNSFSSTRRMRPSTYRQNQSLDETILARHNRLRKQRTVKPFSSLDDNCVQLINPVPMSTSRSISPMNIHSESDVISVMKKRVNSIRLSYRNGGLSSSTGNLVEMGNKRNLAKRLAGENTISSLTEAGNDENDKCKINKVHKGRIVKNLNEFLNFANLTRPRILGNRHSNSQNQSNQFRSISEGDITPANQSLVITVIKSPVDEIGSDVIQSDMESISEIHNSSPSYSCNSISPHTFENDESSPDDSNDYTPMTTSMTKELRLELDNLDRQVFGSNAQQVDDFNDHTEGNLKKGGNDDVFIWENPLKLPSTPDEQTDLDFDETLSTVKDTVNPAAELESNLKSENSYIGNGFSSSNTVEEATDVTNFLTRSANNIKAVSILNSLRSGNAVGQILRSPARSQPVPVLPNPEEFGDGNPFLMFLCLTLLRQHRDHIMQNGMDYNEMAMHFDKMVRKHNVTRVLDEARQMFASYLKQNSLQNPVGSKQNVKV